MGDGAYLSEILGELREIKELLKQIAVREN